MSAPISVREAFIESAIGGDGWKNSWNGARFYTSSHTVADQMQTLCVTTGIQCSQKSKPNVNGTMMWDLQLKYSRYKTVDNRPRANGEKQIKIVHHDEEDFFCYSVPSGILVTRRNGRYHSTVTPKSRSRGRSSATDGSQDMEGPRVRSVQR